MTSFAQPRLLVSYMPLATSQAELGRKFRSVRLHILFGKLVIDRCEPRSRAHCCGIAVQDLYQLRASGALRHKNDRRWGANADIRHARPPHAHARRAAVRHGRRREANDPHTDLGAKLLPTRRSGRSGGHDKARVRGQSARRRATAVALRRRR